MTPRWLLRALANEWDADDGSETTTWPVDDGLADVAGPYLDGLAAATKGTDQRLAQRGPFDVSASENTGAMGLFSIPNVMNSLLPLGKYEDGSTNWAWPAVLADSWEAIERGLQGPEAYQPGDALVAAGLAPMVALGAGGAARTAAPVADRAAAGGGRIPLDGYSVGNEATKVLNAFTRPRFLAHALTGRRPDPQDVDIASIRPSQRHVDAGHAAGKAADETPVDVFRQPDGSYILADGHHRWFDRKQRGDQTTPAYIYSNPKKAALPQFLGPINDEGLAAFDTPVIRAKNPGEQLAMLEPDYAESIAALRERNRRGLPTGFGYHRWQPAEPFGVDDFLSRDPSDIGMTMHANPKEAALSSNIIQGIENAGRSVDSLGFYSKLDEVLGSLNPTDRVTAQTLQSRGVKAAEIEARGLRSALDNGAVPVSELQATARANPVEVREVKYGDHPSLEHRSDEIAAAEIEEIIDLGRGHFEYAGVRYRDYDEAVKAARDMAERVAAQEYQPERGRWSSLSLDPSNPTYRETVLHLPSAQSDDWVALRAKIEDLQRAGANLRGEARTANMHEIDRLRDQADAMGGTVGESKDFRSGHWSEPNVIAHARTSMVRDAEGRPVFHIDELQSDWGRRLRGGGMRDEAKITRLKNELSSVERDYLSSGDGTAWLGEVNDLSRKNGMPHASTYRQAYANLTQMINRGGALRGAAETLHKSMRNNPATVALRRVFAELGTAEQAVVGHPLVNTTDQWVNTSLRRLIRQAVDADADYMAIPSGDTVAAFSSGEKAGLDYAYNQMYPKNLRNILSKIDPEVQARYVDDLYQDAGGFIDRSEGHTLFPLTETVRKKVRDGLPLFSNAPTAAPLSLMGDEFPPSQSYGAASDGHTLNAMLKYRLRPGETLY